MSTIIELQSVTKYYEDFAALKDIYLTIEKNEFVTLLGPSGCGKTTTLRLIGGFEQPSSGKILFEGKDISDVPPYKRQVNTVFQKYALFNHMNVYENIAFGLKIKKLDKKTIDEKVANLLELVNLAGYQNRSIDSLSGGQQQRVAIARGSTSQQFLLDEPLGALDLKLRKEMQLELKKIQQQLGITFVFVTHDQEEALTMSDTIVVMRDGEIQQVGSLRRSITNQIMLLSRASIGESNIIDGIMVKDELVIFANQRFICVDKGFDLVKKSMW